ncbi:nucleoside-diphosphate kinase [Streptococcus dentasini]
MEETFFILKPDAVKRGLVGEVLHRIERRGFQLTRLEQCQIERTTLEKHYSDLVDKPFFPSIADFMMSGPVIIGTLAGVGAVQAWRDMLGATDPAKAQAGTIRGDFALGAEPGQSLKNIAHGSDSLESARREISIWFGE